MTRVCALGVLAAVMSCAPPPERSPDAREAAQRFLDRIDSLHLDGLPSPGQLQSLGSELEPSLVLAFRRAAAAQSTFVAAHPTEKPPLIEGSLFSSLFEGPTGHRIGPIEARHDTARVTIDYIRAEPGIPSAGRTSWCCFGGAAGSS